MYTPLWVEKQIPVDKYMYKRKLFTCQIVYQHYKNDYYTVQNLNFSKLWIKYDELN